MLARRIIAPRFLNPSDRNIQSLHRSLVIVPIAALQFLTNCAAALPLVIGLGHHTDRFAPHSISGWPMGDFVQIAVGINSTDPPGSPTIVVSAEQVDTTLTLDRYSFPPTIYPTPHLYYKFFDLDPTLLGPWEITPTDSTGTGPSVFTNAIADPKFLPVPKQIKVSGSLVGDSVEWTLPDLTGFDVEYTQVDIIQISPLTEVFRSSFFPVSTTSFEVPPGILQVGVEYAYQISLEDVEGNYEENRSNALSEPFIYTMAGDYSGDGTVGPEDYQLWKSNFGSTTFPYADGNHDGIVDAADYTVWRDNLGAPAVTLPNDIDGDVIGQAQHDIWKAQIGQPFGVAANGGFSASVPPAIPEPATVALAAVGVLGLVIERYRRLSRPN